MTTKIVFNSTRLKTRVSRIIFIRAVEGSQNRADGDLALARSSVIVDALLLCQQKCIDDTTFAEQIASIFLDF